nr:MAG TPA: hypothetical protein [Caudoviricetes sp.]
MKVQIKKYVIIIAIIIVLAPVFLDRFILGNQIASNATNGEWTSFFGSYLGSIIGGIITLIVFWGTMWNSKKESEREEKINLFEILISNASIINKIQKDLSIISMWDRKIDELVDKLSVKLIELKIRLEIAQKRDIYTETIGLIAEIDRMLEKIEDIEDIKLDIYSGKNEGYKKQAHIIGELSEVKIVDCIEKFIEKNNK